MSAMEVIEDEHDFSNDLLLLDRVFLRLGNADTDEQLESCLGRFLCPVIRKLSSPNEMVRTKVMELLVHVNKRIKSRGVVQLPVETLLSLYKDGNSGSFIINFTIIYITMGFPRLPTEDQVRLVPELLDSLENKPLPHQTNILMLLMPLLGKIKDSTLNLKEKPKVANSLLKFATDILLLPYRALPNPGESEFQVPPGLSMKSYKRIVEKNPLTPEQLEEMKLSIVNFISKDVFNSNDTLLALIVAAADSRFSVANCANSPLIRVTSSVDWSLPATVGPLYSLYLGTWGGMKVAPDDQKVAACTRLRLKLIQYLSKATGAGVMFPHCVQVVFSSLFDPNSNARLKNMALMYLLNVINNGDQARLKQVATVFLQGLLKVIRSDEHAEHHPKAYMCLGRLAMKCPSSISNQFALLEELVKKIPEAVPEMRTALRDALLEMSAAYKINPEEVADSSQTAGSSKMKVEEASDSKKAKTNGMDEPQALALFALLDHYMHSEESMIRYVATRYAACVFPARYVPARYLLLLASGDSQDEISTEALKCLYGTSRPNEIEDVVNNVTRKDQNAVALDQAAARNRANNSQEEEFRAPAFKEMVNYVWEQTQKRKKGSNAKHRFVVSNLVLQFHPITYQEILRYLRMCLNRSADLRDCSDHPNATSPLLAKYFYENLLDTEVLERYLTTITTLLAASPEIMPLTSFLDIVGCVPEKMASKYTSLLPFLKNLFVNSTKEEIRETSAVIYSIITVATSEKSSVDKEIKEFVAQSVSNKNLESQCGYTSAFAHLCERCISLSKRGKFGGKGFSPAKWEPFQEGAVCLVNHLSSSQSQLVGAACRQAALLARAAGLPLPAAGNQAQAIESDNPFNVGKNIEGNPDPEVTKFSVADRLFRVVANAKLPSKIKEKALFTLGLLCVGERFPYAKHIMKGFLQMAKDSKEFEIHLQIGESLVLCVEGVNSNENRDLWTELPKEGVAKVKDAAAQKENDELLEWLLQELFKIAKFTHPHSRQATSIWLLALLKNCPEREPIKSKLQILQDVFMDYLSENSEIVQDVASKGLSLVYQNSDEDQKKAVVAQIIEQLTSGKRSVAKVTEDTKIFEEGQLGKAPTGGNLSTYKELCSLASDLNQPDLLYKFMHLAHHNSVWNSKKGAAFGFQSIALQAGPELAAQLPRIVPRLYRYRFDPTPRIQQSMASIWHALVSDTTSTVRKYHKEILDDLVTNLTSNQWRVRMSCCNALSDLLRGANSLHDSLGQLACLWAQLFRVMDDVHEGTRQAAANTALVLSKLCIRASDVSQGKDGREIVSAILPVLLETGITNIVREVRAVSLQTVSKLVTAAGDSLKPFLPELIPALITAAGELESTKLSYLSTALGTDSDTREVLDDLRANAARHHYTTDTVVKCMPFIDINVMTQMLPKTLELTKSPHLGSKVACCHFFILTTHHLRGELEPIAGKIMSSLLNGSFDRNSTVRKNYSEALGQIAAYAKPSSVEKLMKKLVTLYDTKEDDVSRSAIALILRALSKAKLELIKDHEDIIAATVFLAKHAPKEEESATVEMFAEVWSDISPGQAGLRRHLASIRTALDAALASSSWTAKIQAANAIKAICTELTSGLGEQRERLLRSLLAAAHGKTFAGKEHILAALAELCTVKEGESPINPALAEDVIAALLVEARKPDLTYKRHAVSALAAALAATRTDRYEQVLGIVESVLTKDDSSMDKDSDDEDTGGARLRRDQLAQLKEAAYDLLGKAWPKNSATQEKYQEKFFTHCSSAYASSSRSTQLSILTAMAKVLEQLSVLDGSAMEVDGKGNDVNSVTTHVATVVEYTLKNSNQVRHRRDALNIMDILLKKLKDLNCPEEVEKLRNIYQTYAPDLSKDSSHEIRTNLDTIKAHFK